MKMLGHLKRVQPKKAWRLTLILLLVLPIFTHAQDRIEVKGYVKDEDGKPLQGVSITKKSDKKGTSTDANGFFSLKVANAKVPLTFSFVGYTSKTVKVDEKAEMSVVLERTVQNQEEVVVIGYGTAKRKDVTGAVGTFKPKRNDAQQFGSVDNLMRGRVAGVQVQQSGGDPGGAVSVKIRGINSLRGDNEPLYVVDGVIVSNVTLDAADPFSSKTANSGQTRQSGLAGINPQDIESIEVLKDASATAIYGSRGANGVVIITTKTGKGKPVIMASSFIEFARVSKRLDMLDAKGYGSYINDFEILNGRPAKYGLDTLQSVNWQDELTRTALTSNNRVSVSGSSLDNKTKYFFAGGYIRNDGVVEKSGFKQGDLKLNLGQELSNKVKMNFTLSGLFLQNSMSQSTEPTGSPENSMTVRMLTGSPVKNDFPVVNDEDIQVDNPRSWIVGYDDLTEEKRILAGLDVTYKISKWLSYKIRLAADYRAKERKRWFGKETITGRNANGSLGLSQFERKFYQLENLLMFNKRFSKNNLLDGTLGVTYDNENISSSSVINENFFSEELRTEGFGFGQVLYPYLRNRIGAKVFSVLGRINYSYADKYLLTLSGRTDGSSRFATGNKFSFFPAVAVAWKVSSEKFMNNSKIFSNLKVRLGYGKSGNQAIDPYGTFARYGEDSYVNGNLLVAGSVPLNIQNKNLKWETTDQFNAGIDASFVKNRISFTADLYHKKTSDLLQTFVLPGSSGFQVIPKNIGTIENSGVEFSVGALLISKKEVTLNISGNIAFNRNKILDLGLTESQFGINNWEAYIGPNVSTGTYFKDPANIFVVGQPIGMFYGYKTNGVFQSAAETVGVTQFGLPVLPGDLKIVDQNGDKDINPDDRVLLGNPNPKFVYGFGTNLVIKNWTFDLFFNGSYGGQIANGNLMRIGNANGVLSGNILAATYNNAWTATKGGDNPRVGYNNLSFIDRYVEDGSFLRMAVASVGYSFYLKDNRFIKSINVTVSGKNLFTITKYTGFDPEVNSFSFDKGRIGVDWGAYPNLRSFSAGINLSF